jgi:hypothetical protein
VIEVAHQGRTGLTARDMTRWATHIDIDNVGAGGFRDPSALRHPVGLAACELNDMGTYSGGLASQPRHWAAVDEIVTGGHLGHHQPGAEFSSQPSKRGVGDARHRRQKDPVGDFNIAYFQRLKG